MQGNAYSGPRPYWPSGDFVDVSNTSIPVPSRVERARVRLERAVADIEAAAKARASLRHGAAEDLLGVKQALAASQVENAALKDATDDVLLRLDDVIGRLRIVLEE